MKKRIAALLCIFICITVSFSYPVTAYAAEHEVIVGTDNQTITLKHEAHSRALFAEGAIAAADFIINKAPGLYDMNSLISNTKRDTALSAN